MVYNSPSLNGTDVIPKSSTRISFFSFLLLFLELSGLFALCCQRWQYSCDWGSDSQCRNKTRNANYQWWKKKTFVKNIYIYILESNSRIELILCRGCWQDVQNDTKSHKITLVVVFLFPLEFCKTLISCHANVWTCKYLLNMAIRFWHSHEDVFSKHPCKRHITKVS